MVWVNEQAKYGHRQTDKRANKKERNSTKFISLKRGYDQDR
jgi:hypothetical protein